MVAVASTRVPYGVSKLLILKENRPIIGLGEPTQRRWPEAEIAL